MPIPPNTPATVEVSDYGESIFVGVEATEQAAVALPSTAALFASSVAFKKVEEVVKLDRRTALRPNDVINRQALVYWDVAAEFPYSSSGAAGSPSPLSAILLGCGAKKVTVADTSVTYMRDTRDAFDALTMEMRQPVSGGSYDYRHLAVGCRGQFGFSVEIGKEFTVSFKGVGRYAHPDRVARLAPGYGAQLTNLFDIVKANAISIKKIGARSVCLQSLTGSNCFGWDVKYMQTGCSALPDRAEPMDTDASGTLELFIAMPDWMDAANGFNPYIAGDRSANTPTVALEFEIGTSAGSKVVIGVNEAQLYEPTPAVLPNKLVGMKLKCDIVDGFSWVEK
ncbi:MAG: Synechococcus phage [Pseudomonadota bacterium]|jgi:hypothetical protein